MVKYLLAIGIMLLQEIVLFNGLLFATQQGEYNLWAIHLIFILATLIDIWIGYAVGRYAKKRWKTGKLVTLANKGAESFHEYTGKHGRKFALIVLGHFSFPYVNAFIASWLAIPFWEGMLFLTLGNLLYYASSWLLVLGLGALVPNPMLALLAIGLVSLLLTYGVRFVRMRYFAKVETHEAN